MNQLRLLFSMLLVAMCLYVPANGQQLMGNPDFQNYCSTQNQCTYFDAKDNFAVPYCSSKVRIPRNGGDFIETPTCRTCRGSVYSTHGFPQYVANPYSTPTELTHELVLMESVSNPLATPAQVPRGQGIAMRYYPQLVGGNATACVSVSLAGWRLQGNTGTRLEVWITKRDLSQSQILFGDAGLGLDNVCASWEGMINPAGADGYMLGTISETDLASPNGSAGSANPSFTKQFSLRILNDDYRYVWLKLVSNIPNDLRTPSFMLIQEVHVNVLCTAADIANIAISPTRPTESQLPDRCFCGVRPSIAVEPPRNPITGRMANPDAGETSADQTSLTGDIKIGIDPQTRKLSLQNAPSDLNIEEAKLYDLNGRTVLVSQGPILSMKQIDLSGVASGFYILTLKTSQGLVRTPISF